jgi:small subunit ribosomal protein S11
MGALSNSLLFETLEKSSVRASFKRDRLDPSWPAAVPEREDDHEPYHFHIYSHKHNTHITVTKPNRDAIISLSCGNIGFRKMRRKHYDSAYQLAAYVLERLYHGGWHEKISKLEVVLRGFGQGRFAATKVLMSPEGKPLRSKITKVSDSTRLKFGGTRSKNPRRL